MTPVILHLHGISTMKTLVQEFTVLPRNRLIMKLEESFCLLKMSIFIFVLAMAGDVGEVHMKAQELQVHWGSFLKTDHL